MLLETSHILEYCPTIESGNFSCSRAYPNLEMRLLANSVFDPVTGCWIWIGKRKRVPGQEYGRINMVIDGRHRTLIAHRVSYEEFRGPIPEGMEVDHTCDNPPCINPGHLQLATREEQEKYKYSRPESAHVDRAVMLDTEIYKDYFLVMLRHIETGMVFSFDCWPGKALAQHSLLMALRNFQIVTFNGNHFDLPLVGLALRGAPAERIKEACDAIIVGGLKSWQIEKRFNFKIPEKLDHIDLIEVAPGMGSLKIYGGRLHSPKMQDLPIQPDASISPAQREDLRDYCGNDLTVTELLYRQLLPQLALREQMSKKYGLDLRSKSDAQIAEAVIAQEVGKIRGAAVERPTVEPGTVFKYAKPAFISFSSQTLQDVLALVLSVDFVVVNNGSVPIPKELTELKIKVGESTYRMGIGGLHSTEKSVSHKADAQTLLIDRDVVSYYPAIILGNNWAPQHMGKAFTDCFRSILADRLAAKKAGDKVTADALKITVNGSFGKFGSKWSKLYAPHLMIQTTLTGQLALLMLIETLEDFGIDVVSANTDGVVIKCPVGLVNVMENIVGGWELVTGLETEATEYTAIYSRDVNNYIVIKKDGLVKLKGAYAPVGLQKNPANEICVEAAAKFLKDGKPVEATIAGCKDIRKFVTVRKVNGGALLGDAYLGKAVRWYYSTQSTGPIRYKVNGNMVPRSEGCKPLMELPAEFPADVDHAWYVAEAQSILKEIGG